MVYGPCGGVTPDGACETGAGPCAFAAPGALLTAAPPADPAALSLGARELLALADFRPLVVAEVPSQALSADGQRAAAAAVAGHVDAALLGDAPWARVQLPPSVRASIVAAEGVRPWATLTCRDRNRVALEGELAGLAAVDAPAVHCVTGDHPALGHRPDAAPVFDLDSTRLASLAAGSAMLVSVAESPSSPPRAQRAARMVAKAAAGAHVCFVNHAGHPDEVADFVAEVRAGAPGTRFIACVPLAASRAGLERLAAFVPGAAVPAHTIAALAAPDPVGAAVRGAVRCAEQLLAIDGIDGVDLSAAAGPGEDLRLAAALALAATALGGGA
jgi:5,10-methylenetetrahydrofolate reductase